MGLRPLAGATPCARRALRDLLRAGSPRLEGVTATAVAAGLRGHRSAAFRHTVGQVAGDLASLGVLPPPQRPAVGERVGTSAALADVPAAWAAWAQRWHRTSTLAPKSGQSVFYALLKAGRWLDAHHPEAIAPEHWTRELAAEYIAALDHMRVGDFAHAPTTVRYAARVGRPSAARGKARDMGAMRTFFRDAQEWGWLPRRFNPARALATPRSVAVLIGPNPRVIADDVWAKLL